MSFTENSKLFNILTTLDSYRIVELYGLTISCQHGEVKPARAPCKNADVSKVYTRS